MGALTVTPDWSRPVIRAVALAMLCAGTIAILMFAPPAAEADRVTVTGCEADADCEEVAGLGDLPPGSAMATGVLTGAGSIVCSLAFGHGEGVDAPSDDGRVLLCGEEMVAGMVHEREIAVVELGDLEVRHESGGSSFGSHQSWGSYRLGDHRLIISSTERHWSEPWP